jgi:hypothetical protein
MPHVESVTVHRDGTLSILRAFPQSTPDNKPKPEAEPLSMLDVFVRDRLGGAK